MLLLARMGSYWRNIVRSIRSPKTVGVRALIVDETNRVLLVRHTYLPGWFTPGGGVEKGESPVAAIRREIYEETTLQVTGEPQCFHVYFTNREDRDDYPILFVVREYSGTATIGDESEIAEIGWFPVDSLPDGTSPSTRRRVAEFRGLCQKSDRW